MKVPKSNICLKSPRYMGQVMQIASEVTQLKIEELQSDEYLGLGENKAPEIIVDAQNA